jgi:hypothetical protein
MITQESLAAANLAKLIGSNLLRIDEATTEKNSSGPAVRIDPKTFLFENNPALRNAQTFSQNAKERQMMELLQREAEAAYPRQDIPPQPYQPPQVVTPIAPTISTVTPIGLAPQNNHSDPNQMEFSFPPPGSPGFELFEKINKNLERIAKAIESAVDNSSKKKKVGITE